MEYKDFFSPKTIEKLNKKSAENLKTMLGDKNLMQTLMSSQQLLDQISKAEAPYKSQLEKLAVDMVKELYPIIDEEGIVLDAKIGDMASVTGELDEIKVNNLMEAISPESRRRIINSITQGAALRGAFAFYLFKEHLDDLDPSLVEKYNQIMKNSFGIYDDENAIAMMLSALAQGQKAAGGISKVIIKEQESGITIKARAINFPMLVHELIKGLYELISLQGFKGDKAANQATVDKTDLLKNEPTDIRYGKFVYDALNDIFTNSNYDDPKIREFFFIEVYQLEDDEFISFIENALNDELTSSQQKWVNDTLRDISIDLRNDAYDNTGIDESSIKLIDILREIKVNKPKLLQIVKFNDDWGLLVDHKYLFGDTYHHPSRPELDKYEIIYASVDVEGDMENNNEYLNIYIPEPSFGGGAPEDEIERAYDRWDEDIAIAEKVLTPYSDKKVGDSYLIKLNKISNTNLIPSY